jgi:hypothetical protein
VIEKQVLTTIGVVSVDYRVIKIVVQGPKAPEQAGFAYNNSNE